jgi:hypothetical protein
VPLALRTLEHRHRPIRIQHEVKKMSDCFLRTNVMNLSEKHRYHQMCVDFLSLQIHLFLFLMQSRSASPSPDLLSATTTKVVDAEATAWVLELTQVR